MEHWVIRAGGRWCLITEPQVTSHGKQTGYGNLLRHIEQAVRVAAMLDATLFLVGGPGRRESPLNAAVYDLDSGDVRIIGQSDWRAPFLRAIWRAGAPLRYGS